MVDWLLNVKDQSISWVVTFLKGKQLETNAGISSISYIFSSACCDHLPYESLTLTNNRDGNVHRGGPQLVLHLQSVDALIRLDTVINDEGSVQVGAGNVQSGGQRLDLLQWFVLLQPLYLWGWSACDGDTNLDGVPTAEAQTFAIVWWHVDVCWCCWRRMQI